jgi:hypothetical protein
MWHGIGHTRRCAAGVVAAFNSVRNAPKALFWSVSVRRDRVYLAAQRTQGRAGGCGAISTSAVVWGLMAIIVLVSPASAAAVCATSSTVATGRPAYFQFAAASQAKTAWARKVGRDQKLGRAYGHWGRARDARVTCRQIAQRYRCVAVADPCRFGTGLPTLAAKRGST